MTDKEEYNNSRYTPGRAGRQPRHDIGFSDSGDWRPSRREDAREMQAASDDYDGYGGYEDDGYGYEAGDDYYPEGAVDYYPEDDGRGYCPPSEDGYYPSRERDEYHAPRQSPDMRGRRGRDSYVDNGYRAGYRDGYRDNESGWKASAPVGRGDNSRYDMDEKNNDRGSFRKRHPVLMNVIYALAATVLAAWIALWFLDFWTFHGQERAVPDVKGQSYDMALGNIDRAGLRAVVTDSIYDSYARPGTVVEQSPVPSARIKKGGTVYLTLVAYTPKMVTIPDFYDVSERQARSMLEGLGITQVMTVGVPSEYAGLVLGAKFNGVALRPGAKVPVTAVITLEVGEGMGDYSPVDELVDTVAIEQTIEALNID